MAFDLSAFSPDKWRLPESPQNALMRGLEMQRAQQGNALQAMQLQALAQRQQQEAAAQEKMARYLASVSGQAGPPQAFNPLEAFAAGIPAQAIKALTPAPQKVYSMGPGGQLRDATGRLIAETPFKPEPQKLPAIGELQAYRETLPPNDPKRREVQALIENQTRPPKYASAPGPSVVDVGGETQADFTRKYGKAPANYRWKADGSLEAIPGGAADQKSIAGDMGKGSVNDVAANLRDMYDQLDKANGITNPNKGTLENVVAGVSSSGPGQAAGRLFGTQNQSLRNTIAQQRPLLLQAIMKATGMSAKQMDSNAELKLYLATATDPTLDVAANRRALDMIEKLYGKGSSAPAAAPAGGGGWKIERVN